MYCKKFLLSLAVLLAADHVASLPRKKIVGGDLVSISDVPYSASIQVYDQHICTGAFIKSNIVLTAGHCVFGKGNTPMIYDYKVVSDRTNLKDKKVGQQADVKKIYVHKRYHYSEKPYLTVDNDIAVFMLDSDISENTLELPEENESFIGKDTSIAGWGRFDPQMNPDGQLRYLEIDVLNKNSEPYCSRTETPTICVRAKNAFDKVQGTCQGDSGGVLQSENKAVGIVSYGACNDGSTPSTFTEVAGFVPFIKGILSGEPTSDAKAIDL